MTDPNRNRPEEKRPVIEVSPNGPYLVTGLANLRNSMGVHLETRPAMALCRCGGSADKPFCDGMHAKIGFSGEKREDRVPDRLDDYEGQAISIHDNRGVCSHIGHCTDNLPMVFRMGAEPWIDPDGAKPADIGRIIRMCPSGALSYSRGGVLHKEYDHAPEIFVGRNRSYHVIGGIELKDPDGNTPETTDHYTLCRCGNSKNKPFCDGSHWYVKFEDEKN
jgi:CDGSH-type Zn-finger protein